VPVGELRGPLQASLGAAYTIERELGDKARAVSLLDFKYVNDLAYHYHLIGELLRDYPPFQDFIRPRG
jgi:hypothetical protein